MESNRWAICINLNNLKEFDDLFENKKEYSVTNWNRL